MENYVVMNRVDLAKVKQFLKHPDVQDALSTDDLDTVYTYALNPIYDVDISYLTEFLFENKINPLQYTTKVYRGSFLGVHMSDYGITQLTVPSHIEIIEEYGFYDCTGVDTIVIEDGCESIGEGAFAYNSATKVYVPDSVKHIGDNTFRSGPSVIYCNKGSFTETYCSNNRVVYKLI